MTTATYPVTGCAGDARGFYQVLGVARTASTDEINRARKRELRKWHPDHASEDERAERGRRATLINEAAETLLDSTRRYRYDREPSGTPREDDDRREQAAARAEQARRASAEEARRAAAEANRRAAQARAQRDAEEAAAAERQRVRLQRKRQVSHALWCLAFLALVPQLATRQLIIPVADIHADVLWTSTVVLALGLAHLWIGATTRVFVFRSERSRVAAATIVVLQVSLAAILLLLAPAILLLIELLKIAAVLAGIFLILMLLSR